MLKLFITPYQVSGSQRLRLRDLSGFALSGLVFLSTGSVYAQKISIWSGYPEMAPFYQRVRMP